MVQFAHQSRLAKTMAIAAFVVSILCAVASTGFLLSEEYRQGKDRIKHQVSELGRTSAPSIALGLWVWNLDLVKVQVEGLSQIPFVAHGRVIYEDGEISSTAGPDRCQAADVSFPLVYLDNDRAFDLGVLILCPDFGPLESRLVATGIRIFLIQLFFAFTLALALFRLFYRRVGQPIAAIAGQAKALSPGNLDQPIGLERRPGAGHDGDELDVLINSLNAMRVNLKHSILELRRADAQHRILFETLQQGVVYCDADARVISANPAALRLLGDDIPLLMPRPGDASAPAWVREDRSPIPVALHPVMLALKQAEPVTGEVMGLAGANGEVGKWLSVTVTPLFRDGTSGPYLIHVTFEDITAQKLAGETLRRYEHILSSTNDLMSFVDTRYVYRAVNDAYLRAHARQRHEIVGSSVEDMVGSDVFRQVVKAKLDLALAGEAVVFEEWFSYRGFGRRYMKVFYHPFRDENRTVCGVVVCVHDLTEIKEAETALFQSELKYKNLFDNMAQGVFYQKSDGAIVDYNAKALEMFGLTADQLLGRTSYDPAWKVLRNDGSDYEPGNHPSMQALTTGIPVKDEVLGVYNPVSQSYRWLSVNAFPQFRKDEALPFQVFVTMHDITALRQAEADLQMSHERFLTVLNSIEAFIYVSDLDTHEVLFLNQFMTERFGADLTGKPCHVAFREAGFPCSQCKDQNLLDNHGRPLDARVWTSQSAESGRWYINQNRAIQWTGGRYVRLHIVTDITEFKQMESDLRQAQKMESIGTLAGGVAHDFNNILSIILGNAELALDDLDPGHPGHGQIKEIKTASLRAKGVIRQLLNFSRKSEYVQECVELDKVLFEVRTLLRSTLPSNIDLRTVVPEGEYLVMADPIQIHQVFMNLFTNAYQAMPEKGGIIEAALRIPEIIDGQWRGVRGLARKNYVEVIIRDNGPGIKPEVMDRIFDPYFTTKAVGQGTGLGLSVVQGIIQNHEGHIQVKSRPGQGTVFYILLPAGSGRPEVPRENSVPEIGARGAGRILVVDDDERVAEVIRQFLTRQGYVVDLQTHPVEAVRSFISGEAAWDLIITDMTMPEMNGLDLAEQIRIADADIPIIVCTGHSPLLDDMRASRLKIRAFVMKPVTMAELSKLVRETLAG